MNYETETPMPHNLEAEQAILGTLLRYPDAIRRTGNLTADHFHHETHTELFKQFVSMIAAGETLTPVTLGAKLDAEARKYMVKLYSNAGEVFDIKTLADQIIECHARRLLIAQCERSVQLLRAKGDVAGAIAELQNTFNGVASSERTFHDASEVTFAILDRLKENRQATSTGILKLDEAMGGGLEPGRCYGIGARKKVGKTILAGTISHNLNLAGVKHLFICGEMGEVEIHQRVVARSLGLYKSAFRSGYAERPLVMERIEKFAREIPRNAIYYDAPGLLFDRLKSVIGMAVMKHGIKGFILDYFQLVRSDDPRQNLIAHYDEVAQWLADYSKKLGLWCIAMAQINQEGNTRNGEGMRLAFDQVFQLHAEGDDPSNKGRWLEMLETRDTAWLNVGSEHSPALLLNEKGPFFEETNLEPTYSQANA